MSRTSVSRAQLDCLAVVFLGGGLRLGFGLLDEHGVVRPVPGRHLMTPTRSGARCTRAGCCASIRNRCSPSSWARTWSCRSRDRLDGRLGQGLGVDEPLIGQPRLDDRAGAVAVGHHHQVVLDLLEQPEGFHLGDDLLAGLQGAQPLVAIRRVLVQMGVARSRTLIISRPWRLPTSKSLKSWGRRDLHRAGCPSQGRRIRRRRSGSASP